MRSARAACGRVPTDTLGELAAAARELAAGRGSVALARTADDALHDTLAAHCGNAFLAREIGRLKLLFRAYRDVSWDRVAAANDLTRIPGEAAEHLAVLDAVAAADRAAASRAMAAHIRSGERYWVRTVFANGIRKKKTATDEHG